MRAVRASVVGMLVTEVNRTNIKSLLGFLRDRLSGKIIELQVEANGKKLQIKASSQAELMAVIAAAQQFVTT